MRYHVDIRDNNEQSQNEIADSHNRHQDAAHTGDALNATKGNEQGNSRDDAAHHQRIKAEGLVQSTTDGIALDGIIGEAKSQRDEHGEQSRHPLVVHAMADVIGRTTNERLTGRALEQLSQRGLDKSRCRANKRNQPHPEDSSGATHGNGGCHTSQVARAHTRRHRDGECLERRNVFLLAAMGRRRVNKLTEHVTQHCELHKSGANREIQATKDQCAYQQIGPQGIVNRCDYIIEGVKVKRHFMPILLIDAKLGNNQ